MWIRGLMHRVMQEAGAEDGGGGGGGTGADGSVGNDAGQTQDNGSQQQPAGSLLKQGEGGSEPLPQEFIPEKYRVSKEGGEFDLEASARKMAEAHGHLEKRLGSGDIPPKEASEYKIAAPEAFKDYDASDDPMMQAFLADGHKAGLTQGQLDVIMDHYFKMVPALAGAAQQLDLQQATEALEKTWGTDQREFQRNAGLAHAATRAGAERAGLSMDEVEAAGLGNNPVFLRLMAAMGSEFQEDTGPGKSGMQVFGEDQVQELMLSEAYRNDRHPDHAKVSERVRAYFERKHGTRSVA